MNAEKLTKLQVHVRIGGKGTARRKKKVVHRTATADDKKLQNSLKRLDVNNVPDIDEANMIKDDGTIIHFKNPKVQATKAANIFTIAGHAESKKLAEMLPGILDQLETENLFQYWRQIKKGKDASRDLTNNTVQEEEDELPDLIENFDEPSKLEVV